MKRWNMCLNWIKGFSQPWKSNILTRNVGIVNCWSLHFPTKKGNHIDPPVYIYSSKMMPDIFVPSGILKFLSPSLDKGALFLFSRWWRSEKEGERGRRGKTMGEIGGDMSRQVGQTDRRTAESARVGGGGGIGNDRSLCFEEWVFSRIEFSNFVILFMGMSKHFAKSCFIFSCL